MPVHVLSEGAGPGAHLTRISIPCITTDTDCSNKTVKGKVVRKGRLVSSGSDDFILKTVIQEDESQPSSSSQSTSINVVLTGSVAKEFDEAVSDGDVVVASGFTVERSGSDQKDQLHRCKLLLSGDDARLYVSSSLPPPPPPPAADPRSPSATKRSSSLPAEVSSRNKTNRYTYVRLGDLEPGCIVNVYGVVVFFKQPFKCRGTDLCSSLKIIDQSNQKVGCTIFCDKLEKHPKIFQIGDIIRMHRVKTQSFNDSMSLISTLGFSVVTFGGAVGGAMEPRTSGVQFTLDQQDLRMVEELRSWAATEGIRPAVPTTPLSDVKPKAYFDLTCQLLAKAPIDSSCTLLRVWDGTSCPRTLLKVIVEPGATEGPACFSQRKEQLIANVLVYDNHVEVATELKPGAFLRIYNLRAIPGSSKVPGLTSSQSEEVDHLAFHLHGGTAYGRGIRVLPETSPEVQKLKRTLQAFSEDEDEDELLDCELLEVWSTPPETMSVKRFCESASVKSSSELSCSHVLQPVSLSEVKRSGPGRVHHVRVQMRSYEPQRLHQALKLYCSTCTSMRDVPDEDLVAGLFQDAFRDSGPCAPPPWLVSGEVQLGPGPEGRTVTVLLASELLPGGKDKELLFLLGSSLEETRLLTERYQNVVPVRSCAGRLSLLDLTAPFLFTGGRRFYGCKRCSPVSLKEPSCEGVDVIDVQKISEAVGVQLLQFVLLMKLQLQDDTDALDVFLWRDAEQFFSVSPEDAAANQEAQRIVQQTMDTLCPPGGSTGSGERPWLDLCLTSYQGEDDEGRNRTCYQICHSSVTRPGPA